MRTFRDILIVTLMILSPALAQLLVMILSLVPYLLESVCVFLIAGFVWFFNRVLKEVLK
jgi:hypothetical protein